jgi:hypothetical protein
VQQNNRVDLLGVAKTLDPRFAEDMPQEIADAFARGDVQRIFRTSKHAPQRTPNRIIPQKADKYGDYQGSIYVQHKDGRVARFKNPEVAFEQGDMRHAGWKAKTAGVEGRSPFFDQAHVIDIDSYRADPVNSAVAQAVEASKRANPGATNLQNTDHLANLARHNVSSVATPTTSQASSVLGRTIFETNKPGSTAIDAGSTHMGDRVTDIYESTGERFFFQGDTTQNVLGDVSSEPISDFLTRRSGSDQSEKSKAVSKTVENNRPVIKVGEVVESNGEKVKKEKAKEPTKPVSDIKKIEDSVIDAVISDAKPNEDDEKPEGVDEQVQEKIKDKIEEKVDPLGKAESYIDKKTEQAKEKLVDSFFEADNQRYEASRSTAAAKNIETSTSSDALRGAAGRAPTTTPAARAALAASGEAETYAKMPIEKALRTALDDGMEVAKSVLGGFKNSKNIRLAATAALLSSAGYGLGKLRDGAFKKEPKQMSVDEEQELRRGLMSDG